MRPATRERPMRSWNARRGANGLAQALQDLGCAGRGGAIIERHAPPARAGLLGRELDGPVVREVVVRSGQDLVAPLERQAGIHQREAGGGAGGDGDLVALYTQVSDHLVPDLELNVVGVGRRHLLLDGQVGLIVERAPIRFDRVTNRARVRDQEEAREMELSGLERELGAHGGPGREVRERARLSERAI